MDAEITLGDVKEQQPAAMLRPDRNQHYAVAVCGAPAADDLPIFLELDVLRELEAHAASNVHVELGGVLLGGQHRDDQGRPFVLIADSLRAEHYEATRGSFKFTHDTWREITRQRDRFPAEFAMVGWYHTHPGWGVFLSGMDRFICDHFFNRPLDVALVIDPCKGDRGLFHWAASGRQLRQVRGFWVIASRFRREELDEYVWLLEGGETMSGVRTAAVRGAAASTAAPYPAPVVNLHQQQPGWLASAVVAMLAVQVLLTAVLAWKVLGPVEPSPAVTGAEAITERIERLEERDRAAAEAARLAAQRELLDRVVAQLGTADGPQRLASQLEEERSRNEQLRAAVAGLTALEQEREALTKKLQALQAQRQAQQQQIAALRDELRTARAEGEFQAAQLRAEIQQLRARKEAGEQPPPGAGGFFTSLPGIATIVAASVVALIALAGAAFSLSGRGAAGRPPNAAPPSDAPPSDTPPPDATTAGGNAAP